MALRRMLPLAAVALGALTLSGCVLSPPALAPQAPATSDPTTQPPASSSPATSAPTSSEPTDPPSSSTPAAPTGSTVTIDGQPAGSWGQAIECSVFGGTALLSASDDSGSMFGTGSDESGSWQATAFLLNDGDSSYVQQDETAPAAYDGATFSTEFVALDLSGSTVTVAISAPC